MCRGNEQCNWIGSRSFALDIYLRLAGSKITEIELLSVEMVMMEGQRWRLKTIIRTLLLLGAINSVNHTKQWRRFMHKPACAFTGGN